MPLFTVRCTGCGAEREALLRADAPDAGLHLRREPHPTPRSTEELDALWRGEAPGSDDICGTWVRTGRLERPWSPPSGRYSYGGA